MIHELKIRKQWADAKLAGEKPFEIRVNDRGFQKGDIVHYTVIDPKTNEPWRVPAGELPSSGDDRHPLERCDFIITYVIEGKDGLERGYCVFADQPVPMASVESKDILRDTAARCARFGGEARRPAGGAVQMHGPRKEEDAPIPYDQDYWR